MKILIILLCGLAEVARSEVCSVHPNSVNLGLFGNVCQSSTYRVIPHPGPERAVDGISETNHTAFTCAITDLEEESYWSLDMEGSYMVGVVIIILRQDGLWNCLKGAVIRIGDSPDYKNPVCDTIGEVPRSQAVLKYFCKGMQGRYVTIIHAGQPGIISLCEVKVYQHVPPEQKEDW